MLATRMRMAAAGANSDAIAPTLSSPTATTVSQTTASGSVSTDEANGVLYWFVSTSGTPPTAANLKAGTGAVAFGNQVVSATGVQSVASITGLTAETTYYIHYLHRDLAGNDSSIATSSSFLTWGNNLISNGSFASDTVWTKGTGWSIGSGKATKAPGSTGAISQSLTLVNGQTYRAIFTISSYVAGSTAPRLTGAVNVNGSNQSGNGTYQADLVANSGSNGYANTGTSDGDFKIDDVQLFRVA